MSAAISGKENTYDRMDQHHTKKDIDLPSLDLSTIDIATRNFSASNILGEGGFGPVYKVTLTWLYLTNGTLTQHISYNMCPYTNFQGVLANGQEIAVKRLSKTSGQGIDEFRNEVLLIANLQHRNLVKILGCCIQNDERILIYEFMPNRSLDLYIFGLRLFALL